MATSFSGSYPTPELRRKPVHIHLIALTRRSPICAADVCMAPRCWSPDDNQTTVRRALASVCISEPAESMRVQLIAPVANASCLRATSASASDASGARRRVRQCSALLALGKDAVDDRRMTSAGDSRRFIDEDLVHSCRDICPIAILRQSVMLADAIKCLALDVGAKDKRAGNWGQHWRDQSGQ